LKNEQAFIHVFSLVSFSGTLQDIEGSFFPDRVDRTNCRMHEAYSMHIRFQLFSGVIASLIVYLVKTSNSNLQALADAYRTGSKERSSTYWKIKFFSTEGYIFFSNPRKYVLTICNLN